MSNKCSVLVCIYDVMVILILSIVTLIFAQAKVISLFG